MFLFFFTGLSIWLLIPMNTGSHDTGSIASELSVQESADGESMRSDYVDLDGNVVYAIDKHYASVVRQTDSDGKIIKEQFFDEKARPARQPNDYYGLAYTYNENGFVQTITYLDEQDAPCMTDGGYAAIERTYDSDGNALCDFYLGEQLRPIECTGGYYGIRRVYQNGKYSAIEYLSKDGSLIKNSQGYARKSYHYNEQDGTTSEMYFDEKSQAVRIGEGMYGIRYTQNEKYELEQIVYLDAKGVPSPTNAGYTMLKRTYHRDGTADTDMYYDQSGNPIALSKGQYGIKHIDKTNLLLDKDGHIMFCIDNILNGFPFMVVLCGCAICLLMLILPKKLSIILTGAYVFFIFYETLMFRETGDARMNLVLFSYADRFLTDQSIRAGVINNIWLFIPLGTGLYRIFQKKWVLMIPFLFSVAIEVTQYITGLGIAELDDVFGNTLGGCVGVLTAYAIIRYKASMKKN